MGTAFGASWILILTFSFVGFVVMFWVVWSRRSGLGMNLWWNSFKAKKDLVCPKNRPTC